VPENHLEIVEVKRLSAQKEKPLHMKDRLFDALETVEQEVRQRQLRDGDEGGCSGAPDEFPEGEN